MMPPKERAPDPEFNEPLYNFLYFSIYFTLLIIWIASIFMENT